MGRAFAMSREERGGGVKGAEPEYDSVLVVYIKHTHPVFERTKLDPWLGYSFPLQRKVNNCKIFR